MSLPKRYSLIMGSNVYAELAQSFNYPPSELFLRILEKIVTPEESQLLLELPAEPDELAKKLDLDEESINGKISELLQRGLVAATRKGLRLVRDVAQLHDSTVTALPKFVDTELLDLWKEFYEAEWQYYLWEELRALEQPLWKIIPARGAIERSP